MASQLPSAQNRSRTRPQGEARKTRLGEAALAFHFAEPPVSRQLLLKARQTGQDFSCKTSPFFEIALVLVRLDHVASGIVNANHSIM
jgi:hypothetical protein